LRFHRIPQLLWELDNGRAVGLAGVPDVLLRSQLQHTLDLLGLKLTKVGTAAGQQAVCLWISQVAVAAQLLQNFILHQCASKHAHCSSPR
jgi:hypothetical protein